MYFSCSKTGTHFICSGALDNGDLAEESALWRSKRDIREVIKILSMGLYVILGADLSARYVVVKGRWTIVEIKLRQFVIHTSSPLNVQVDQISWFSTITFKLKENALMWYTIVGLFFRRTNNGIRNLNKFLLFFPKKILNAMITKILFKVLCIIRDHFLPFLW